VRLTYNPIVHYILAGGTFLTMLLLCVAMSPHTTSPIVAYTVSGLAVASFIPTGSSRWIAATAEFVSIVSVVTITYLFFSKTSRKKTLKN
jgi:hypothetical protein